VIESSKLPRECVGGPGLWHRPLLHPYHRTCYQRTTLPVLHLLWVLFLRLCAANSIGAIFKWGGVPETRFFAKRPHVPQIASRKTSITLGPEESYL